ncbi:hypothetical protein D3C78_1490520 [compost metagenome]
MIASKARAVSSPDFCRVVKALPLSGPDRASKKLVMPCWRMASRAARVWLSFSASVAGGTTAARDSAAPSSQMPFGLPALSRRYLPSSGSGVFLLIPASSRPRELVSTV